jgi:glucose 1-dehydrogenase
MASIWDEQVAVVTGASGSIGAAIAEHLSALGAAVAGADLTMPSDAKRGARRLASSVDVTQSRAVESWIDEVGATLGCPTIGVICAGISRSGRLIDTTDADWNDVMNVNLNGAFYTARAIIRRMLAAKVLGRLVFIGSWSATSPHPHIGGYSASKAGLRALCQTLALDHARDGILINEVAPGIVNAGVSRELFRLDPALERRTRASIPSGGVLLPEDVARDVEFVCSPRNHHTTGAVIISDGGLSLASTMNPGTGSL